MTTTPTERMIAMLQEKIFTLTAERDEARREVCLRAWGNMSPLEMAASRKWDCFDREDVK